MREFSISVASHSVSGPKDEVDADGEVEHSTLILPSQVSETSGKQQEEDEDDSTIHTAIRDKVCDDNQLHIWQSEVHQEEGS